MDFRGKVKHLFRMCGHAMVSTIHDRMDVLERDMQRRKMEYWSLAKTQTALLEAAAHQTSILHQFGGRGAVEMHGLGKKSPEAGLMEFLYSYLPARGAIDIGAHTGEISESLLASGYEVYAFEPFPPRYEKLVGRLGDRKNFHAFRLAIGCEEAEMPLHLTQGLSGHDRYDPTLVHSPAADAAANGLRADGELPVAVTSLASLHASKQLPEQVGLVKIDTEGFDLEVIRGMGAQRYPVVVAEFWDEGIPLAKNGLPYTLKDLVAEMKDRGYLWHTVLYQIWMDGQRGYYSNYSRTIANSWGSVFFFQEFNVFSQADAWCSAVLPRAYFQAQI